MPDLTSLKHMPLSVLLGVVVTLGPLMHGSLTPGSSFHDNQRILQLILLVAGVAVMSWRIFGRRLSIPRLPGAIAAALALFLVLGLVSSAHALSPRHALTEWSAFWLLLVLSAGVAHEISAVPAQAAVRLWAALIVGGASCVVYIAQALTFYVIALVAKAQPDYQAMTPGFDHFRFLNHVQTVSLPLLAWIATGLDDKQWRLMWWRMTALWWMLLFVTGGRGAVLGIAVGAVCALLIWRREAWPWCRSLLLTGIVGFGVYLLLYMVVPDVLGLRPYGFFQEVVQRTSADPASGRFELWAIAWDLVRGHPWLGAGPMHYAHRAMDAHTPAHPHNWVLQIAAEWGLPALLCLIVTLVLVAATLYRSTRRDDADPRDRLLAIAFCGGGMAILADGLVSGLIVMPMPQLWLVLFLGCAWGWLASASAATVAPRSYGWVLAIVGFIAIGVVAYGSFPEVLNIPAHEAPFRPPLRAFFAPRWWRNGYF